MTDTYDHLFKLLLVRHTAVHCGLQRRQRFDIRRLSLLDQRVWPCTASMCERIDRTDMEIISSHSSALVALVWRSQTNELEY